MTFLAPGYFAAALVASLAVVALHLIVMTRPRAVPFPTARFAPGLAAVARSRSLRLSDLLLLLLRVLAILCAGAALARPVVTPQRERIARVILGDVSGSVRSVAEVRDSVKSQFRRGDAIVAFDTVARSLTNPDSIRESHVAASGSLSAAMVAALRAAAVVREGADSVELVIVSPALSHEYDRATAGLREQWRGRARLIHVTPAVSSDSAVVPATVLFETIARPRLAIARNRVDTVGAVVANATVVIGSFERRWRFVPDSIRGNRVVARWIDGEPAAVAIRTAQSCTVSAPVPMDSTGDLALRPSAAHFRASLAAACAPITDSAIPALANLLQGSGRLAAAASFAPAMDTGSPLARWLAITAILLAIAEMVLRRSVNREPSE